MRGSRAVQIVRRLDGGTYAAAVTVTGCNVAVREQPEPPVPSWPPLTSGRTVYAPAGTVVASRDRVVIAGVTYEADGDSFAWDSMVGTAMGVVFHVRRSDDWFDTSVSVRSYLGSSGMGATWADAVSWPAHLVSVSSLAESSTGDESAAKVTVRVPAESGGESAVEVFTPGSVLTVAGSSVTVVSVAPVTRGGVTEYVEVSAQ